MSLSKSDLENFKDEILFDAIHATERSNDFKKLCDETEILLVLKGRSSDGNTAYGLFFQIASGVIHREKLTQLCKDIKTRVGPDKWKALHGVWNEGDENYYQEWFAKEIHKGKQLMLKLRPYVLEQTKTWTVNRKQDDLVKPEGRFLKGWYSAPEQNIEL